MPMLQPYEDLDELSREYPDFSNDDLQELSLRLKGIDTPDSASALEAPVSNQQVPFAPKSPGGPSGWNLLQYLEEEKPQSKTNSSPNKTAPKIKTPPAPLKDFEAPMPNPNQTPQGDYSLNLDDQDIPSVQNPVESDVSSEKPDNSASTDYRQMVLDEIKKKYNLDQFSPENRQKLSDQYQNATGGPNWAAGFGALGAGLQGHNAVNAGLNILDSQRKAAKVPLDQFDQARKQAFEDAAFGENVGDKADALAKTKKENDPNSDESKLAQALASKMGVDPNTAKKITASQFKAFSPTFSKMYETAANNASREKIAQGKNTSQENIANSNADKKTEKPPQQWQYDYAQYGKRIQTANKIFDTLEGSGYKRQTSSQGFRSLLPNKNQSSNLQQQTQAERNFLNAVLRKESGAAISQGEHDIGEKQYFPRAGDSPEVLANKKQNRKQAELNFKSAAGSAWDLIPTAPTEKAPSNIEDIPQNLSPDDVIDGYKYKGGDPSNEENWEKAE